ncbi:MAG: cysteine desulfurase-like protein [Gemmatimonadota bacterium]
MIAPLSEIRDRFPALQRSHEGREVAYFDGPGGTQVPASVADAVSDYLLRHNANTHWGFPTSAETDEVVSGARAAMADLLDGSPGEIVFGPNMTTLTFHVARALGRKFPPGSEIVVTELDHRANVDPWLDMARMWNFEVRTVPFRADTGTLELSAFEAVVNSRTRLIAVGGASNALGTVNDVAAISAIARRHDSLLFVDAVHSTPHFSVSVEALDCDLLACSPYKFYGPHVGVLWGRKDLLEVLDSPRLRPASDAAPERLETGTLNHEGLAGTAAAVEFLASLDSGPGDRRTRLERVMRELHLRGDRLAAQMWEGLSSIPGVRVFGPAAGAMPRTPTVSFVVGGVESPEVARRLAFEHAVFCSHGDFYASDVTRRLGIDAFGLVRAGAACYTASVEVSRLIDGVRAIAESAGRDP